MFDFENGIEFEILDVLYITRRNSSFCTAKRNFSVISTRIDGSASFFWNEKEILASKNDYLLIPANVEYAQKSDGEELICVHLSCDFGGELCSVNCSSSLLKQLFIKLYSVWQKKEKGYLLRAKGIVYEILYELLKAEASGATLEQNALLRPALDYIFAHFQMQSFSLSQAISLTYISPAYFRKLFRAVYRKTPVRFVNELRIEYAKALLEMRVYTVEQIAQMSGFQTEKYFYSVFKQITGITPASWLAEK